jgi:DNA-directed RNA polymerase subunit H (RpoH/RPB5)
MNPEDLFRLLKHIIVWVPENNPIRNEIKNIMDQIKNGREKLPDIEFSTPTQSEIVPL